MDIILMNRISNKSEKYKHCFVWENLGKIRFDTVPVAQHGLKAIARDMSYGDLNDDGYLDIVTVDGSVGGHEGTDTNRIWLNNFDHSNNYIKLQFYQGNNKIGIGTKVTVLKHNRKKILGYDEVRTDFNYRSKRDAILNFGVKKNKLVDIKIETRQGKIYEIQALETNENYLIELDSLKIQKNMKTHQ